VRNRRFIDRRLSLNCRESSLPRFATAGIQANDRILLRALDVTDAAARLDLIAEIEAHYDGVDVLVNNAGIAYRSVVEHVTEEERVEQMGSNFVKNLCLLGVCFHLLHHQTGKLSLESYLLNSPKT
jgi:NAD(P)-dependent dehydrogenase (short-subunit alcohol dehydrogenase family)